MAKEPKVVGKNGNGGGQGVPESNAPAQAEPQTPVGHGKNSVIKAVRQKIFEQGEEIDEVKKKEKYERNQLLANDTGASSSDRAKAVLGLGLMAAQDPTLLSRASRVEELTAKVKELQDKIAQKNERIQELVTRTIDLEAKLDKLPELRDKLAAQKIHIDLLENKIGEKDTEISELHSKLLLAEQARNELQTFLNSIDLATLSAELEKVIVSTEERMNIRSDALLTAINSKLDSMVSVPATLSSLLEMVDKVVNPVR